MKNQINSLRVSILILLATAILLPIEAHSDDMLAEYPVRFAIIGDRTGEAVEGIYEQIIEEIERLRPDFVITVGDMIEGYSSDTARINVEWREYMGLVEKLSMPIYFTPGNHDITYDGMQPTYEKFIGAPNYSFDHRGLHFVILDNSRQESWEELPTEQIDWVIDDLQKHADAAYTFVFFHKPLWYRTLADNKPDTLHNIFRTYGVDAVVSGHFHQYFSGTFDGILYTCIGTSGGGAAPGPTGFLYHFGWVTVDGNGIHIVPIEMGGVKPWDLVPVSELRFVNEVSGFSLTFPEPVTVDEDLSVNNQVLSVRFTNPSQETDFEDTLVWDIPEGWAVEPTEAALKTPASETTTSEFTLTCTGDLYPLPAVSTSFEYAPGRQAPINKTLPVARPVTCLSASTPPVIDGELSETTWNAPVSNLLGPDGKSPITDSVSVAFAWDKDNLYWSVYCHESVMDSLAANMTGRDDAVYGEDCFGVMLCPEVDQGVGYQFYVNPIGTVYDQRIFRQSDGWWTGDETWNGTLEVASSRGDDFWILEVRLPLEQLGVSISPSDNWRVLFRRKQARLNSWAGWQIPWQYDASGFGSLWFR